MLILSRKASERIVIDKDIVITVTKLGRKRVKIGISAPRDKIILREELIDKPQSSLTLEPDIVSNS